MMTLDRREWAGGALLLAAALASAACGGGRGAQRATAEQAALPAALETASETAWPAGSELTASVLPFRRATPGTVLMGRVDQVLHREGDRVRAGTVLARVESRDVAARLAQARAGVTAARAMEENARLMKERMERLHASQAATQKNLEDARAGHEAASANLEAAREGVKAAELYVAYSNVTAPFDGVIVEKRIELGDMAAPGMPLFVVEDTSKMKIEAAVPESAASGLASGRAVEVEIPAAGAALRRGAVSEILPAADPRSRTFTVRVLLDNHDGALRSGMFARLHISAGEAAGAPEGAVVTVPETALVRQGPLAGLFVVDDAGVARLRWITTGETREGRVAILTGLSAGERFVVSPPPELADGRRVEVK